ncbi:MAG: hypothetical protein HY202_02115 [Nitrospirae bacterium]|nr:hypothetical protein [Nitrospirota bacterium]
MKNIADDSPFIFCPFLRKFVLFGQSLFFGFCMMVALAEQAASEPPKTKPYHFIHAIAIDPHAPKTIYAATDNQGLLKSGDGGRSWHLINRGLKNYLVYDVKASLTTPGRVYAATWGGGFYQSADGGESWKEVNDGLGNTAAGAIRLRLASDMAKEKVVLLTSTDVYERMEDEPVWRSITGGLRFWNNPQFQSFEVLPDGLSNVFMGTDHGLYKKDPESAGWVKVNGLADKKVASMTYDKKSGIFYAGTVNSGGIFISRDGGVHWNPPGPGLEKLWIRMITVDAFDPSIVYAATSGAGIFKSRNGGDSWEQTVKGLTDLEARALAIDPLDANIIFAGTHGAGLFKSMDGGRSWDLLTHLPFEENKRQQDFLESQTVRQGAKVSPPPPFKKCNKCHGWTDKNLNQKTTYWRVAANERDWKATVARMSEGTEISSEEQEMITAFLESYTKKNLSGRGGTPR